MAAKIIIMPRDRLAWHKQMAEDCELSHVAFRLAVIIGSYFNNRTGRTFVGYDTLAARLKVNRATVWRALRELMPADADKNPKGRGHLAIEAGGGRNITSYLAASATTSGGFCSFIL